MDKKYLGYIATFIIAVLATYVVTSFYLNITISNQAIQITSANAIIGQQNSTIAQDNATINTLQTTNSGLLNETIIENQTINNLTVNSNTNQGINVTPATPPTCPITYTYNGYVYNIVSNTVVYSTVYNGTTYNNYTQLPQNQAQQIIQGYLNQFDLQKMCL